MTYFRVHRDGLPEFDADNAWSAPWGSTFITPRFYLRDDCMIGSETAGSYDYIAIDLPVVPDEIARYVEASKSVKTWEGTDCTRIVVEANDANRVYEALESAGVEWWETLDEAVGVANRGYSRVQKICRKNACTRLNTFVFSASLKVDTNYEARTVGRA